MLYGRDSEGAVLNGCLIAQEPAAIDLGDPVWNSDDDDDDEEIQDDEGLFN